MSWCCLETCKLHMKRNRRTCATRGTMLSTAVRPITAQACGRRRAGRTGKGGERWKVLQQKSRHLRLAGPWCPSAAEVKLRVWSLPLGGPWALRSHTSPPVFNRQPCLGPTLAFCPGGIREQLWWTSSCPCSLYYSFFHCCPFTVRCALSGTHTMLCITFSKLSVRILLPPSFKTHTLQHLPLCLFILLSLLISELKIPQPDLSPTKCFLSFQPVCEHCGFPAIPVDPFHLYGITLLWWCRCFWSKLNFQILVAWSHFQGRVFVFRWISLQSKDSKDYSTSTVLVLILHHCSIQTGEAKQGALGTEDRLCHSCHCQSAIVLPPAERPAHSCSR